MPQTGHTALEEWLARLVDHPPGENAEHLYQPTATEGAVRLKNLRLYLRLMFAQHPSVLFVGEAPGYQGSRRTGVPFTSEYIMLGGLPEATLYTQSSGFSRAVAGNRLHREPTATFVWRAISRYSPLPLLWAAYPHHPHQPGIPQSNRTPTRKETELACPLLVGLIDLFDIKTVVAVGNVAKETLDHLGIRGEKVRHPAHGGALRFDSQVTALMTSYTR